MKMHVLVVALLGALAARAATAASEGGDTYSAIQEARQLPHPVVLAGRHGNATLTASDTDAYGPEGFETWSHVLAQRHTLVDQGNDAGRVAPSTAMSDASVATPSGASEGGDTFSRFIPQSDVRGVGVRRLASVPPR